MNIFSKRRKKLVQHSTPKGIKPKKVCRSYTYKRKRRSPEDGQT